LERELKYYWRGKMVSFLEVIKKLIPGSYFTSTGNPHAPEHMEQFVKEVKSKVPELADREDWDAENTVIEAVDWAINNICKSLDHRIKRGISCLREIGLFECFHPSTGKFYMVFDEETDADFGSWFFGFDLTRSREKAEKLFKELIEELE